MVTGPWRTLVLVAAVFLTVGRDRVYGTWSAYDEAQSPPNMHFVRLYDQHRSRGCIDGRCTGFGDEAEGTNDTGTAVMSASRWSQLSMTRCWEVLATGAQSMTSEQKEMCLAKALACAPMAHEVELVAFRGCDKWQQYGSPDQAVACSNLSAPGHRGGGLTLTGHVGLRFQNGCSCPCRNETDQTSSVPSPGPSEECQVRVLPGRIYGFLPVYDGSESGGAPPLAELLRKRSFPGYVSDDTLAFITADSYGSNIASIASQASSHREGPLLVVAAEASSEGRSADDMCLSLCEDLSYGTGGIPNKRYSFPFPNSFTDSAWWVETFTGLSAVRQEQAPELVENVQRNKEQFCNGGFGAAAAASADKSVCHNCATFPASIGASMGDVSGEVEQFLHLPHINWKPFRRHTRSATHSFRLL